ncbi:hypothetical protein RRG08_005243 [Elysia crispata]|uniref:Uncharacterized protein n=1 Tax=Elysia crispata TaxID=231223 RepID=A0AAE0YCD9_9GAST|nr:hypothetical protein RRG08_005243 [Elysia crispata]
MNTKLGSMLALDLTLESKHSNVVYTEVQSYLEAQESRECLGIGDQKKSPSPGFNIFVVELCITRISQCEDDVSNACRQISWREGRKQNVWTLPPDMGSTATNLSVCTMLGMSRGNPLSWAAPNATNNQAVGVGRNQFVLMKKYFIESNRVWPIVAFELKTLEPHGNYKVASVQMMRADSYKEQKSPPLIALQSHTLPSPSQCKAYKARYLHQFRSAKLTWSTAREAPVMRDNSAGGSRRVPYTPATLSLSTVLSCPSSATSVHSTK